MAAMKLVKHWLILIFFCTEIERIKGMQADNEAENTPDAHIIYDQRQSGKYNIHVVIKDVAIIEMDENKITDQNYNDEEYYYDEDDLTIKPLNIKTTSTTSVRPLDTSSSVSNKTTPPTVQTETTTTSFESPNTSISQGSTNPYLSTNVSKSSIKETHNNQMPNLITFLTTHSPAIAIHTKSRSKVEPIYAIEEPAPQPRHHWEVLNDDLPLAVQSKEASLARGANSKTYPNSKIFKVKVRRSHQPAQSITQRERCRSNQYRDGRGNCRGKRSSSGTILKRLFKMLLTLPFRQDEQQIDN